MKRLVAALSALTLLASSGDAKPHRHLPPPPPPPLPAPSVGLPPIASNFDVNAELYPAPIPGSNSPDTLGAFRFICMAGQLLKDDPIVYPGQPGKSHLHQFYGNTGANASSTYESLRTSGDSTCMSRVNRSGYWMPGMLDGHGGVVRPDYVTIYYKRLPLSDPKCSLSDPAAEGNCVPLPNGLRFIFGFNMPNPADSPTGQGYFNCDGPTGTQGHYASIPEALSHCPTAKNPDGSYNRIGAIIQAPGCWDGQNLDSPDHRSHVAYPGYVNGVLKCPSTHPNVIPTFVIGAWYRVSADGEQPMDALTHLSSDEMFPDRPAGSSLHADWFGAWDNSVMDKWMAGCINQKLNCSSGTLGNGQGIKQSSPFSWTANPRTVPAI